MSNEKQQKIDQFTKLYQSDTAPWNTGITPPEIKQIIKDIPTGTALDLGCGTGTTMYHLLENGWQVDGVDFVQAAIDLARTKLAQFSDTHYSLYRHDVTNLKALGELRSPYDLVIDIGCGHNLAIEQAKIYVSDVASMMKKGGVWMLYAHQPTVERTFGWKPQDVHAITESSFNLVWEKLSNDTSMGVASGWYQLIKK